MLALLLGLSLPVKIHNMEKKIIEQKFAHLFENDLIEEISKVGALQSFQSGAELMDIGEEVKYFPLVAQGSLKVMTEDSEGHELLLYYLEMGDTCAMTLQCCLGSTRSKIRVVAEEPTDVVLLPIGLMEEWIAQYPAWRRFIFSSYHERLNEMLEAIDKLAFQNLEERLFDYLKDKAMINGSAELKTTHKQIAHELNTSRVVISRLMKKLEQQGKISSDRNCIQVKEFMD